MTGLSRDIGGILDRFADPLTPVAQLVCEFHDQNAVLGHDAHQQDEPDLAVDVERCAGQKHGEDRAGEAQRHGCHDDQGADETLELGCEHQQDDDDRKAEGSRHARRLLAERCRFGKRNDAGAGAAEKRFRDLLSNLVGFPERKIGRQSGGNPHRAHLLFSGKRRRNGLFDQACDCRDRYETPVTGLDEDVFQIGRVVDRIRRGDEFHVEGPVVDEHLADLAAVKHGLHRRSQAVDIDPEVRCALAVDRDRKLRLGGLAR